jgi:hypothetical protein
MPDTPITAPSQPAPPAQTADAAQSNGPDNVGVAAFAQRLAKHYGEQSEAPAPAPITAEPTAPAVEPAPEAPAAEATQPEPTHAEEADEALSQSTSIAPEVQEVINKRIAKITAKRKDAERRAEAAEAALAQMAQARQQAQPQQQTEAPVSADVPSQPLANIQTIRDLQKLHSDATEAVRFAEYNLDRDDVVERQMENGQTVKGVVVENQFYTKDQLRTIKYNALRTKDTEIPARAQFLTQQQQAVQQALEAYPFLKDQSSPEYQLADTFARQMPWLKNVPNSLEIIGKMVLGSKVEQDAKAKPAARVPVRAKPSGDQTAVSSSDTGITRAPVSTVARREIAQEEAKLSKSGGASASEFAALLTRKAQAKRTL